MSTPAATNVPPGVTSQAAPIPRNRVTIETDLRALLSEERPARVILDGMIQIAVRHAQAEFVALYQPDAAGNVSAVASHGKLESFQQLFPLEAFLDVCRAAAKRQDVISKCLSETARRFAIAVPVMAPGQPASILSALISPGEHGVAPRLKAVEMIAGALSQWRLTDALERLDWEARTSSAVIELVSGMESADSVAAASFRMVNELQNFSGCQQVVLGTKNKNRAGVDIKVVSGVAEFDKNSVSMGLVQAALDETLVRNKLTAWPPLSASERHSTLAHRKLVAGIAEDAVLSAPLVTISDETVGAILLVGRREMLHLPRRVASIEAMRPHLATAFAARQAAEPGAIRRACQSVFGADAPVSRRLVVLTLAVAAVVVPMIPCRYKVKSDCVVEPVTRRFVVAPYDGLLQSSLVRPGDLVEAGDVLARMDDRELRWELSRLAADRGRAAKKRDVAMAAHDTSESQLAELEQEALDVKIRLLKHREENLEITASLAGMILKGDLEDAEGAPVQAGQALFEVAPLNPVKLELAVVEEDLPMVREGMTVLATLDGYRGARVEGQITNIHPRSEIRDQNSVFIAEVQLQNLGGELRPGMSGLARVKSKIKPLGWIWLHKAVHRARLFLGV